MTSWQQLKWWTLNIQPLASEMIPEWILLMECWCFINERIDIMKDTDFKAFLEDNFIIFNKNDIIDMKKLPQFGSVTFTVQDGKIIQIETTIKER